MPTRPLAGRPPGLVRTGPGLDGGRSALAASARLLVHWISVGPVVAVGEQFLIAFGVVVAVVAAVVQGLVLAWGLKARKARTWKPNGPPTPGFYRDPFGSATFRWWNGHGWTDRTNTPH